MKLDFLHLGGGATPLPRAAIERQMRRLDIKPLDHAGRAIKVGLIALATFVALFVAYATSRRSPPPRSPRPKCRSAATRSSSSR